jgi:NIPSNAP
MIHQLRIYEIFDRNKEAFHKRFQDHAWRIMRSYGFNILGTWETRFGDRTEFVYLLVWPDEKTMRHAWEQFKANEEWKKIKKDTNARHGDLVGEIQDRMLTPTSYSQLIRGIEARNRSGH